MGGQAPPRATPAASVAPPAAPVRRSPAPWWRQADDYVRAVAAARVRRHRPARDPLASTIVALVLIALVLFAVAGGAYVSLEVR